MKKKLEGLLTGWNASIISDTDIFCYFEKDSIKSSKDLIGRAISWGWLKKIKRGLYVVGPPFQREIPSLFVISQHIYGPSYISMESAFSYYQMIPEAVYATVAACSKRSVEFDTPSGLFIYRHIPVKHFYEGVKRVKIDNDVFFIATPLKALGDYIYATKKVFSSLQKLEKDLRLDLDILSKQPPEELSLLNQKYPSQRVKKFYKLIEKELNL